MNSQQKITNKKKLPPKLNIVKRSFISQTQSSESDCHFRDETQSANILPPKKTNVESSDKFYKKYELRQKIGQGTSAVVYKCVKKNGSGNFAVKITKCEIQQILNMKKSFNTIILLDHESIIQYKSMYIQSSKHKAFLVMELFEHPNLASVQLKNEEQIQHVSYKILEAISYMHQIGLCHRDIKPQNILYDQKQRKIKIIDFGISRQVREGRVKKQMMTCTGTLFYKAPQLFKGGFYDQLIDEWAAGITIYKLLTGVTPFQSQNIRDTIENIQKRQLTFSQPAWSKYSQKFSTLAKQLILQLLSPRETRIQAFYAKNSLWFKGYQQMHHTLGFKLAQLNDESSQLTYSTTNNKLKKPGSKDINLKNMLCNKEQLSEEFDSGQQK